MSTKTQVQWRRAKVLELSSQGYSQIEIAKHLQVDEPTISRDIKFMRDEAFENVREYTTEQLPFQFKIFTKALQSAIQTYWRLSQEAKDDHDKIDAMERYISSHQTLWTLLSGGQHLKSYITGVGVGMSPLSGNGKTSKERVVVRGGGS